MLKCYVVEPELEKRRRFCQISSKSHALEAFWRGLEEPGRSSGGVLEEVLGILGGLGEVAGLTMSISRKNTAFESKLGSREFNF